MKGLDGRDAIAIALLIDDPLLADRVVSVLGDVAGVRLVTRGEPADVVLVSTRRFNEQVQHGSVSMILRSRCVKAESLSWSVVEVISDVIALRLADRAHASAFRQILS